MSNKKYICDVQISIPNELRVRAIPRLVEAIEGEKD
jgi:hypothetical protein